MSSKAKALLKKLRNKSIEEKEKNRKETPEPQGIRTIGTMVEDPRRKVISVPKSIKDEKYNVDPLDYFKTEHINIEAMNMSEYAPKVEIKEVDEKKQMEQIQIMILKSFQAKIQPVMTLIQIIQITMLKQQ